MKLFMIELNPWDYDAYYGCIVAANSIEEVIEKCKHNGFYFTDGRDNSKNFYIEDKQEFTVKEIKLDKIKKAKVLFSGYCGG